MKEKKQHGSFGNLCKGTMWAIVVTLVLILTLAIFVRLGGFGGPVITAIVQIIKVLSIFYGVGIALRAIDKRGWLWGGMLGMMYTIVAFALFGIIGAGTSFVGASFSYELLFASAIGAISAILIKLGRSELS